MKQGFTVVELLITLVIIATLMSLGVVSFLGAQVDARDSERASDIAVIARGLENYYKRGNSKITFTYRTVGAYPSANEFSHIMGVNLCSDATFSAKIVSGGTCSINSGYASDALIGTSTSSFTPPVQTLPNTESVTTNTVPTTNLNAGKYVYQPLAANGAACSTDTCPKYVLYYQEEADPQDNISVKSRHQ